MLLNAHPEVCTAGELKATSLGDVSRYRCSCGQLIRQCDFWARVRRLLADKGVEFDVADAQTDFNSVASPYARRLLRPLHRGSLLEGVRDLGLRLSPTWRRELAHRSRRNAALAETLAEATGARWIVDSSKVALRLKYLLRNPAFNVKVIHLIRDGRAVALTYTDPAELADAADPTLRGGGSGGDRRDERLDIAAAAREWRRSNEAAEAVLARLPRPQWRQVRYEQYCADPAGTLSGLFEFLGVDPVAAKTDFRAVEHHVLGNGMRLDSASEVRLDERWKASLSPADAAVFAAVAGKTNEAYGYK